mmetsp:Transcript_9440/g.17776  ORF Transcript_9440/g.17776 Transcript_9440/m.17776 type:complete len:435 (-) Transcript_9440:43-1347(-)
MPKRPTSIFGLSSNPPSTFLETNTWTMAVASKRRAKVRKAKTSSWSIQADVASLPNIPLYYIPSTTCVVLKDSRNPQVVSKAIADAISELSCVAEFNETQASALVQSIGNVKLSINLYRNEINNILVELHRIDGDVIEYHSLARSILQAAKNQTQTTPPPGAAATAEDHREKSKKAPLTLKRHPRKPTVLSTRIKSSTIQSEASVNKTMDNIQKLIKKDRVDAMVLGMESLAMLIGGASSSTKEVRLLASNAVLCNDSPWPDIKGMLFGTVMDCKKYTNSEQQEEGDSSSDEDDDSEYYHTKLRLALTIIGNSANVLCGQKDIQDDVIIELDEIKELLSILSSYVKEYTCTSSLEPPSISSSPSNIQTVYQASRCIFHLITLSEELRNTAMKIGVLGIATDCIEGGCTSHKLLSDISKEIVAILGQQSKTEKIV